jgi:hypothetical protein
MLRLIVTTALMIGMAFGVLLTEVFPTEVPCAPLQR